MAELPLDVLRWMQTLEWDSPLLHSSDAGGSAGSGVALAAAAQPAVQPPSPGGACNPRKTALHKAGASGLLALLHGHAAAMDSGKQVIWWYIYVVKTMLFLTWGSPCCQTTASPSL